MDDAQAGATAPLRDVVAAIDELLMDERRPVRDYGPNGLQVDSGKPLVARIATGVTSNLAFIEQATAWGADLAVVHHGIYWDGAPPTATGALGRRLRALIGGGLSLVAYHLPLDAHPDLGNAAGVADRLGFPASTRAPAFEHRGLNVGCVVDLTAPLTPSALVARVRDTINPEARAFLHGPAQVSRLGIVTGGAPRDVVHAARLGCDAYLTGEAGEYSQADAREEEIHFIAGGHHRTERYGPLNLTDWLRRRFPGLDVTFIDVDNPV